MEKMLDDFYPYHWDSSNDDFFKITIYPSLEDKLAFRNGKEYYYSMRLDNNVNDNECCKVRIDGTYYYFG